MGVIVVLNQRDFVLNTMINPRIMAKTKITIPQIKDAEVVCCAVDGKDGITSGLAVFICVDRLEVPISVGEENVDDEVGTNVVVELPISGNWVPIGVCEFEIGSVAV